MTILRPLMPVIKSARPHNSRSGRMEPIHQRWASASPLPGLCTDHATLSADTDRRSLTLALGGLVRRSNRGVWQRSMIHRGPADARATALPPMVCIRFIPESKASGDSARVYRRLAYFDGTIDEASKALWLLLTSLEASAAPYNAAMYGDSMLSRVGRKLVSLRTGHLNGCTRCVRHDSARRTSLVPDFGRDRLQRPAHGDTLQATDRERATPGFTAEPTAAPHTVTRGKVDTLHAVGFDDRAVIDRSNAVSHFASANRMTFGLGLDSDVGDRNG